MQRWSRQRCGHKPRNTKSLRKLEEAWKNSFLEPLERIKPYQHLACVLTVPRSMKDNSTVFLKLPNFSSFVMAALKAKTKNKIHIP